MTTETKQLNYRVIRLGDNTGSTSSAVATQAAAEPESPETDEEILERIGERFDILTHMTKAVKRGDVRAMIVAGPPGVGKSHGVTEVLYKHDMIADIAQDEKLKKYEIVKGAMSALGLYTKLYEFREANNVIVFDDCDSILMDDVTLNLLKAALDSGKRRVLSWHTASRVLDEAGVPNSFEFRGGVIFITNIKFAHVRSKKLKDHLAALESRCHYLDLTIDTMREKMLRIRQVINMGMLDHLQLKDEEVAAILQFIDDNKHRLREMSLRMVLKIAEVYKSMPDRWQRVASMSCMV